MTDFDNRFRLSRKDAVGMDELVAMFIKNMRLTAGLNRQRIFEAWNQVSGASQYTLDKFVKDGVLYCRLSSSVARSKVNLQKDFILQMLNARLQTDSMYDSSEGFVKSIVLL
ncbi:MAG: DUF721 domain-containing protein [Bacteroidales bacterium]|nr:DUF721 domain-containing protein [Bacteroidales bacterium]